MSTDYRLFFGGKFSTALDFDDDRTLTMAEIRGLDVEDPDGGADRHKLVISWAEDAKPWLPSKTAADCIAAMFGPLLEGWTGKEITLYNDQTVRVGGKVVGGIRVRGAPSLTEPIECIVRLSRRRPQRIELVPTAEETLADVLARAGATWAAVDAWCALNGKPAASQADEDTQGLMARWFRGTGADTLRSIARTGEEEE